LEYNDVQIKIQKTFYKLVQGIAILWAFCLGTDQETQPANPGKCGIWPFSALFE